ncbi:MAG: DMT family transporter [Muribaculaceae bacterium]|nr:DMT family transporter [Muribaculaceae bacterium]
MKFRGYLLAALAAATYGTNPAFAIPLYGQGMNPASVLLFRYLIGVPLIAAMAAWRGRTLAASRAEILPMAVLGLLMGASSLCLFEAYNYMNSGVASTLLFVYPVMVAVMMSAFFRERFRATTGLCLFVMAAGLLLLMRTPGGFTLSTVGFLLVMGSSLTYALYMVMTNVSGRIRSVPTLRLLFYQLLFGSTVFLFMFAAGEPFTLPAHPSGWINLLALAILPTVVSLICTTAAIHMIGPTPTAIFGALEPVTAVVLSVVILNQGITLREICGGVLIIVATTLVVAADPVDRILLRMRRMFPSLRNK